MSAPALALAVTIAAINTPGYSTWRDTVSRLASPGQPWALLVRIAFVVYGLVVIGGSRAVGRLQRSSLVVSAVCVYGVCAVIAGVAPKDMPGAPQTSASTLHVMATLVGGAAIIGAMAWMTLRSGSRPIRRLSAATGAATVGAAIAFRFTWGSPYYGGIERAFLVPAVAWLSVVAATGLRGASAPPFVLDGRERQS